jgi:secretion/DNA translocation related TadE-like protein
VKPADSPAAEQRHDQNERGSGTVLTATVVLVLVMVAAAVFTLASWVACLHQARSAADLAALAGAEAYQTGRSACTAATVSATANHTTATACQVRESGVDFVVQVSVSVPLRPQLPFGPSNATVTSQAGAVG